MRRSLLLVALLVVACSLTWATPLCTSTTLADYISMGSCTVGANTFSNWSFNASALGKGTVLPASQISVTPTGVGFTFSGAFAETAQNVPIGNTSILMPAFGQYEIGYIVQAAGAWLDGNTLTAGSGSAAAFTLVEDKCLGGSLTVLPNGSVDCGGATHIALGVPAPGTSASTLFAFGQSDVQVRNELFFGTDAGTANLDSFANTFTVPEPVSLILVGSSLLALGLLRRRS